MSRLPIVNDMFCFFVIVTLFSVSNAIEIKIKQGILKGMEQQARNGTKFHAFLGIPYAKPPIGDLRFQAPQPPEPWEGVRDATQPGANCIQRELLFDKEYSINGDEDCLFLNVYKPAKIKSPLPVMVWIHGGGFFQGMGIFYGPNYLLDYEIIIVTINYRLGALGFLSAGDDILPGNYGMKDQSAALKWVQQNIKDFGGNPQQVTIFGESAGAASVHFHMFSKLSTGLFHRAISESGTALALWARLTPAMARQRFATFGILAGCIPEPTQLMVDCLKKISARELVLITQKFYVWDFDPMLVFSIVKEPANVTDAFLTNDPYNEDVLNDVPWIVGINSGEGAIKTVRYIDDEKLTEELSVNYKRYIPLILTYMHWLSPEDVDKTTDKLMSYYFKGQKISKATENNLIDLVTDSYFLYDLRESLHRFKSKPYVYYYDHKSEVSIAQVMGNCCETSGPSHADEILNIFNVPVSPAKISPKDLAVSERMLKYWVNFGYTGKPTADDFWKITKSAEVDYLHIETERDSMKTGLLQDRYSFWKSLKALPPDVFGKEKTQR